MTKFECKGVLCDIEGTTTSISFVKEVLFPYSKKNVEKFLSENSTDPEVIAVFSDLQILPEYQGTINEKIDEATILEISKFVIKLIDEDKKLGPLKNLQGLIWKKGFDQNHIKGHVYSDVPTAFNNWSEKGIKIFIYSSGSVQAQKLLFQNSVEGDLLKYISGYFDTNIGYKQDSLSYKNILNEIKLSADEIIFFTDIVKEAEAALFAGVKTILLDRPGNADLSANSDFFVIKSFEDIDLSFTSTKV